MVGLDDFSWTSFLVGRAFGGTFYSLWLVCRYDTRCTEKHYGSCSSESSVILSKSLAARRRLTAIPCRDVVYPSTFALSEQRSLPKGLPLPGSLLRAGCSFLPFVLLREFLHCVKLLAEMLLSLAHELLSADSGRSAIASPGLLQNRCSRNSGGMMEPIVAGGEGYLTWASPADSGYLGSAWLLSGTSPLLGGHPSHSQ